MTGCPFPHRVPEGSAHKALRETPVPKRFFSLKRDARGYPVPFMMMQDPPSQVTHDLSRLSICYKESRCALCGMIITDRKYWVTGGPAVARNRLISDPPMHEECARYAIKVCPFLSNPDMKYRAKHDPDTVIDHRVSTVREETQILAMATTYTTIEYDGRPYILMGRWRKLEHWSRGQEVPPPPGLTLAELRVTPGAFDPGGPLGHAYTKIRFK